MDNEDDITQRLTNWRVQHQAKSSPLDVKQPVQKTKEKIKEKQLSRARGSKPAESKGKKNVAPKIHLQVPEIQKTFESQLLVDGTPSETQIQQGPTVRSPLPLPPSEPSESSNRFVEESEKSKQEDIDLELSVGERERLNRARQQPSSSSPIDFSCLSRAKSKETQSWHEELLERKNDTDSGRRE